ncbi:MAG: D-aminoacyl-tRNA deacylase [Sutterella sp.]|nr:D-aminoacyl-tRNA deacylase [Sutterella sp.]MDD7427624.1 D-aminoacyl-tRNA deacylase [Sutterella sp.]MDY3272861.1 D-aminoacyl-tRNA deacylase [Duodenibacillus sp.]
MIVVLQRVTQAKVDIDEKTVGQIGKGLMVLVCAEKGDTDEKARLLAQRLLRYRVFEDENGKMNLSVTDVKGGLLLISQFTLAADTTRGNRPSFTPAAPPDEGKRLFDIFVQETEKSGLTVQTGQFGAYMRVSLVNDGPVTLTLRN